MFAEANRKALKYTHPIVAFSETKEGVVSWTIGTYFFLNEDGWFATALHVMNDVFDFSSDADKKEIYRWYAYYGINGIFPDPSIVFTIPEVDLFIGKMQNIEKSNKWTYAVFRNPAYEIYPGTSLCKLGYAFNEIKPNFTDGEDLSFTLPLIYPLDGIFTRTEVLGNTVFPFPLQKLQTSSAGIKGQSGGPVFDRDGNVCAMQNAAVPYDLDFGNHQLFFGSTGVHFQTINSFLNLINVHFHVAQH